MTKIFALAIIFIGLALISIIVQNMNISNDEEISYSRIPKLSKIIYCCYNLENINCNDGDLVELILDNKKEYYIKAHGSLYKLTQSQIKHLEVDYCIKIL